MNSRLIVAVSVALVVLSAQAAVAVPILQIYLEGGEYDPVTETWVLTPEGSSGGAPFRLWTIGNISGPGGLGTIEQVRLSVAYSEEHLALSIAITPSLAGGTGEYQGFTDLSLPADPTLNTGLVKTSLGDFDTGTTGIVTNGGSPVLQGGMALPSHGVFGPGTVWQEYALGDFDTPDSPVGDFIDSFPTELHPDAAQINVYDVAVVGGSGATVHFDLYNHVEGERRGRFAPFSHDADGEANIIPEPGGFLVWSLLGALGLAVGRRRAELKAELERAERKPARKRK